MLKKISFIKAFTSPVYGNVYEGKEVLVKPNEATKLINAGNAVEVVVKKEKVIEKVKENVVNKPKRSKKSSKSRSK